MGRKHKSSVDIQSLDLEGFEKRLSDNCEFSMQLFTLMKSDYKCSKHVFRKKYYPQSIFLLQQSIEKGFKSFMLFQGFIDNPRDFMHTPLDMIINNPTFSEMIAKSLSLSSDNPNAKNVLEDIGFVNVHGYKEKMDAYIKQIKPIIESLSKIDGGSEEQLKTLLYSLSSISSYGQVGLPILKVAYAINKEWFKNLAKISLRPVMEYSNSKVDMGYSFNDIFLKNSSSNMNIDTITSLILGYRCMLNLIILSGVVSSHASKARYPIGKHDPTTYYNKDLPLIRFLPKYYKYTRKTIKFLDQYYNLFLSRQS